jgi:hypothetical protein
MLFHGRPIVGAVIICEISDPQQRVAPLCFTIPRQFRGQRE